MFSIFNIFKRTLYLTDIMPIQECLITNEADYAHLETFNHHFAEFLCEITIKKLDEKT